MELVTTETMTVNIWGSLLTEKQVDWGSFFKRKSISITRAHLFTARKMGLDR